MSKIRQVLSFLKPFLYEYRVAVIFSFVFIIVGRIMVVSLAPLYFKKLIDLFSIQSSGTMSDFLPVLISLSLVIVIGNLILQVNQYLVARTQSRIMSRMNREAYQAVANQDYYFFADNPVGSLVAKISKFGRAFYRMYDILLWQWVGGGASVIVMLIIVFHQSLVLGTIFLAWTIFYLWFMSMFARRQAAVDLVRSRAETKLSGFLADIFTNIFSVKAFASRSHEDKNFEEFNQQSEHTRLQAWYFSNLVGNLSTLIQVFFQLALVAVSIYLWTLGKISGGSVVLLLLYIGQVMQLVLFLGFSLRGLAESISDSVEIIEILEQKPNVVDLPSPEPVRMDKGKICFNQVSFHYPEGGERVFENLTLEVEAGSSVGLVGLSGSGKTTITKLLLRFFDVTGGSITIDGQDITQVAQDELRNRIAYIPQEPVLFHRSLYENIGYGNQERSHDDVVEASRRAHADGFIAELPDTYETLVGERGIKLSGGQRQRIAIARAMLKQTAVVLVMDEATSSLDSLSEQFIQESFDLLRRDRTTIVVAHRLSTVQKLDRIIVLDGGRIVQDGTHAKLITEDGPYRSLWQAQTDVFE